MVEVRGLLGVQATGLIKHHPHCKGSPEEPHQGALFTVVLLHEKGASGLNPSLSYAVGLGATHLSKKRLNFVSDWLMLANRCLIIRWVGLLCSHFVLWRGAFSKISHSGSSSGTYLPCFQHISCFLYSLKFVPLRWQLDLLQCITKVIHQLVFLIFRMSMKSYRGRSANKNCVYVCTLCACTPLNTISFR